MSFESLNKDELTKVADFFNKDVVAADADKGPTKKELIAALASEGDGSDPVSWEDYKEIYLESDVKKAEDRAAAAEEAATEEEAKTEEAPAQTEEEVKADAEEAVEVAEEQDDEDEVLVKMERKNGTYEVFGLRFTKDHPFKSVPSSIAEKLIQQETGFRLALPSEVKDYYN